MWCLENADYFVESLNSVLEEKGTFLQRLLVAEMVCRCHAKCMSQRRQELVFSKES